MMGNPRFVIQMAVELAIGVTAKHLAEIKARGTKCFNVHIFYLFKLKLVQFKGRIAILLIRYGFGGIRRFCICMAIIIKEIF